MSKLVLARNWRKLDKEKRAEFVREFKRHLSRTYGTRLDRYEQEKVDVYAAQVEVRDDVPADADLLDRVVAVLLLNRASEGCVGVRCPGEHV